MAKTKAAETQAVVAVRRLDHCLRCGRYYEGFEPKPLFWCEFCRYQWMVLYERLCLDWAAANPDATEPMPVRLTENPHPEMPVSWIHMAEGY